MVRAGDRYFPGLLATAASRQRRPGQENLGSGHQAVDTKEKVWSQGHDSRGPILKAAKDCTRCSAGYLPQLIYYYINKVSGH